MRFRSMSRFMSGTIHQEHHVVPECLNGSRQSKRIIICVPDEPDPHDFDGTDSKEGDKDTDLTKRAVLIVATGQETRSPTAPGAHPW